MATRFSSVKAPVFRICSTIERQSDTKIIGTSRLRSCQSRCSRVTLKLSAERNLSRISSQLARVSRSIVAFTAATSSMRA